MSSFQGKKARRQFENLGYLFALVWRFFSSRDARPRKALSMLLQTWAGPSVQN